MKNGHASPLDVSRVLKNARLVVVGGTGFLGKVWLSLLLERYPEVGKVFLVVRSKATRDSEARFWTDIAGSKTFDPLRARYPGAAFEDFLREKVAVLDADVSKPLCGITGDLLRELTGTVHALVNVAGVVDFNPPLDEAMLTNAAGVQNLIVLAAALGDVPILHTSTCYVAGYRSGRIQECDPRDFPFPRYEEVKNARWEPTREITEGLDLVRSIKRHVDDAFRVTALEEEARKNLERKGEPTRGPIFEAEYKKVKDKHIAAETERIGMERATYWGWPNTYTYTKSLGEQVLAASGLPFTIVRPSVIESAIRYPFPGWNEGINTMAPITYMFMKGHMQVPYSEKTSLDVIPVDMVSAGMILALAALLDRSHEPVYHLGSSDTNILPMRRIIELCGLYKRMHYTKTGKGNPVVNFVQAHWEPTPVTKKGFFSHGAPAISNAAKTVSNFLRKSAVGPAAMVLKPAARALESYSEVAGRNGEIFSLFVPFMAETDYRFVTDNVRSLYARVTPDDRAKLDWTPEKIDWRHYLQEVQLPGLDKWVMPEIEEKIARPTRPLRAYVSLYDVLDEAAERHEHQVGLMRLEDDGFARVTYLEWKARAEATAARLSEAGVQAGDRVLLAAGNHPDWPIAYFGVLRAGAVAVPVDAGLDAVPLGNILRASRATAAIVDEKVAARLDTLGSLAVARFDIHAVTEQDDSLRPPAAPVASRDTLASVIYTSGTTGTPKGVMLTHGNFTSLIGSLAPIFPLDWGDRMLSVLPLHHTFEFTCGMLLPLSRGAPIVYLDELTGERVIQAMREARISAMVGVPALWQLLERKITAQIKERGPAVEAMFDMALTLNRLLGEKVGADVGRVLFGQVHQALGGRLKYLISGGAALPKDTAKLFASMGLHLSEGYGLTEAAPVLTVSKAAPGAKLGNVGKPIPGVQVKILNPDPSGVGEVLARGPNVMQGYADDPESTAKTVDAEGWLHTGDLGMIDRKGQLTIVGRSKEVIVAANGENLYPDDVERALGTIEYIKELVIVGIDDPKGGERAALLAVPDTEGVEPEDRPARREKAMRNLRNALKNLPPSWQPSVVLPYDAELQRTSTRKIKRSAAKPIVERLVAATAGVAQVTKPEGGPSALTPVRAAVAAIARKAPHEIAATTNLRADLGFDSLMAMELSVALEATNGGRSVPDLVALETVADIERALGVQEERAVEKTEEKTETRAIDDGEEKTVTFPEPVKDVARAALSVVQREFYGSVMSPKVTGRAFIPYNRNALVVANHSSHLDMGLVKHALGSYGKDLVALAARDYFFDTPLKRAFSENFTNLAPFDRDAGLHHTLKEVGQLLDAGKTVLIFPEGTRSPDGAMRKFKGAVGFLALHHRVDVLPVYLGGTFDALPKNAVVPKKRDVVARIGPSLSVDEVARLTRGMKPVEAARTVTRLAQRAVEALRDGNILDLTTIESAREPEAPKRHPLVELFDELNRRFVPGRVDTPVSFYFTLGAEPEAKWTVKVSPTLCEVVNGKPDNSTADCVLKTSPEIFTRIVREGYQPGVSEFMSGAIKSNDVGLLQTFTQAFQLG